MQNKLTHIGGWKFGHATTTPDKKLTCYEIFAFLQFSTDLSTLDSTDTGVSGGGGTDGGGAGTTFCNPRLTGNDDTCGMTRILSLRENNY